jgi:hypothetical protein
MGTNHTTEDTMTTPTPNRPLWRVMEVAEESPSFNFTSSRARMIRAIADEMVMQFDPWLAEHAAVAEWLEAEAKRAEMGDEHQPQRTL